MTPFEICEIYESSDFFDLVEAFPIDEMEELDIGCLIQGCGVFGVEGVNIYVDRAEVSVDVNLEDGTDLGSLVLSRNKPIISFAEMSLNEFYSYLVDVPKGEFGTPYYTMRRDYFVTACGKSYEYHKEFFDTAPIWGGFTHFSETEPTRPTITAITAIQNMKLPTRHHRQIFSRYAHTQNPFDRYLRLYHCVELLYDAITVFRIKELNDDIKDFSAIMSQHGRTELQQLISISDSYIQDFSKIADCFLSLGQFQATSQKVFQEYTKGNNPLEAEQKWEKLVEIVGENDMSETKFRSVKLAKDTKSYDQLVSKICCYWIYRIRCSIAHSKVGEYVIEDHEQAFILEFAEPLLLEFVRQILSSQKLRELIPDTV